MKTKSRESRIDQGEIGTITGPSEREDRVVCDFLTWTGADLLIRDLQPAQSYMTSQREAEEARLAEEAQLAEKEQQKHAVEEERLLAKLGPVTAEILGLKTAQQLNGLPVEVLRWLPRKERYI